MRAFESNGKMNFVDEDNVFVGFDYGQCCCESYGWRVCDVNPIGQEVMQEENGQTEWPGFRFDKSFFQEAPEDGGEGGTAAFRLIRDTGIGIVEEKFLQIWNYHNGYYSHGFEFGVIGGFTYHGGSL